MTFDPYAPYGPVVGSSVRVGTWNVWGRYGDWRQRQAGIEATLIAAKPDIVCLVESWSASETAQAEIIADRLGLDHHLFAGDWVQDDWTSGIGVISRWPVSTPERRPLRADDDSGSGEVLHVEIEGDRGLLQLYVAMLDYPLDASALRQAQVRQLVRFVTETNAQRYPVVVCGDFNAGPDSDEIRMLMGRAATAAAGVVFYDAWEVAGDGTPGHTWSNRNPLAAVGMYPDRRFDYIFSAWPRAGGVGHPTHCELLGVVPADGAQLSDHYGVLASLRY